MKPKAASLKRSAKLTNIQLNQLKQKERKLKLFDSETSTVSFICETRKYSLLFLKNQIMRLKNRRYDITTDLTENKVL